MEQPIEMTGPESMGQQEIMPPPHEIIQPEVNVQQGEAAIQADNPSTASQGQLANTNQGSTSDSAGSPNPYQSGGHGNINHLLYRQPTLEPIYQLNRGDQDNQAVSSATSSQPIISPVSDDLQTSLNQSTVSGNPSPSTGQGGLITSYPINALEDTTSTRVIGTSGEAISSKKAPSNVQQRFKSLTGGITKSLGNFCQCLLQSKRIDEDSINLANQGGNGNKGLQLPQPQAQESESSDLSRTTTLNVLQPLSKPLQDIPSGIHLQQNVALNIIAPLTLTPDALQKVLAGERNVLPHDMVQILTNKPLTTTKQDEELIKKKLANQLQLGPINLYTTNSPNPLESKGCLVVGNDAVPLSPNAVKVLSDFEESLKSPEFLAILNSIGSQTILNSTGSQTLGEGSAATKIKALPRVYDSVFQNISSTLSQAATTVIIGNGGAGQDEAQSMFSLPFYTHQTHEKKGFSFLSLSSESLSNPFSSLSSSPAGTAGNVNSSRNLVPPRGGGVNSRSVVPAALAQHVAGTSAQPVAGAINNPGRRSVPQPVGHSRDTRSGGNPRSVVSAAVAQYRTARTSGRGAEAGTSSNIISSQKISPISQTSSGQSFLASSSSASQNKPGVVEATYIRHEIENEDENEDMEGLSEFFKLPKKTSEDEKKKDTSILTNLRNVFANLSPFLQEQLFKNIISNYRQIEENSNELFPQVINNDGLTPSNFQESINAQKERLQEANQAGKISVAFLDWLFTKDVGLGNSKKIGNLFDQIYNLPKTLPISLAPATFQGYQTLRMMENSLNQSYLKDVEIPRELPFMIMCLGEFNMWSNFLTQFKITSYAAFTKDVTTAEETFYSKYGKNLHTEEIIFKTKKFIGRILVYKLQVDHIFIEAFRGGMEPVLTGRIRKEGEVDINGSIMTPDLPNAIRGLLLNSFINNTSLKLSGLVNFSYALFTHSIKDSAYLASLGLAFAPYAYSVDAKTDDQAKTLERVKAVAKSLSIEPENLDLTPLEMRQSLFNASSGVICEIYRIYQENFAPFNLPPQIQAAVVEDLMRLQSVTYLLETRPAFFNDLPKLKRELKAIFVLTKTLEELGELIHETQKEESESSGQNLYLFESVGPEIRKNLQEFLIKPLKKMRFKPSKPNATATELNYLHQERLKWIEDIEELSKSTQSSPFFQQAREEYQAGLMSYKELLDDTCSFLYESNIPYKVYRIEKANIVGPRTASTSTSPST